MRDNPLREVTPYQCWRRAHRVNHGHCPLDCEHPQPVVHLGMMVCGCCLIRFGRVSPIEPCWPWSCDE